TEPAKTDAKEKADMTKVETPRMPGGKVTVTPLGERAWEIKGLVPPKATETAQAAEPAKTEAPKAAAAKFNVSGLAGKVLAFAALAGRASAKVKRPAPKAEAVAKTEAGLKMEAGPKPEAGLKPETGAKPAAAVAAKVMKGKRQVSALAASVAVAAIAGAV